MRDESKPKRGGARRGPFSGKKMTFTTKLTEGTMERLTAAAKASEMSVSQKGEAAILRGLDAEEDFHLHFAPVLAAFERKMTLAIPPREGETFDHQSWKIQANIMVEALADQLRRAIGAVAERRASTEADSAKPEADLSSAPQPSRRMGRHLDLD